ncbi:MAG: sigma-70 family RNA polymerase sigma factor [Acidobacteriota bacterium]
MSIEQGQSDQELIAACLTGSVSAWEALIQRYRSLIYSIPRRYGFSDQDVADIFQSICVTLLEKLPELRDHDKFRAWLITVVVRQCWWVRRHQRQELPIIGVLDNEEEFGWELAAETPPLDHWLIELERKHQIQTAFARLPERCQQLLRYLFFREPPASYKEIAEETGIAIDSIGPTRSRCLEKFKQLFDRITRTDRTPKC